MLLGLSVASLQGASGPGPLARQPMGTVARFEGFPGQQPVHDGPEFVEVLAAPSGAPEIPSEPACREQAHASAMHGLESVQAFIFG